MTDAWWAKVLELALQKHIDISGQVRCHSPHHPRWDGERCGYCGAWI